MTFEEVKKVTEILLEFLPNTLKLFAWTIVLSIPVGVLVTMLKKCRFKPISWLTNLYILVMRGTPLMLQIIAIYYAVPLIIASAAKQGKTGGVYDVLTNIKNNENYMFIALVTAFVLNYAAYFAEIFRGGIEAIPKGQFEASYAMGMSRFKTMVRIIFPQTLKIIVPSLTGQFVQTVKDSSILSIITVAEMTMMTKEAIGITFSPLIVYICAGVLYWALNLVIEFASRCIEKHNNRVAI